MAIKLATRCEETTTTIGTGAFSLAGANANRLSFLSVVGDGNQTVYVCDLGAAGPDFEIGIGTVHTGSPVTLSRDTIIRSSNSNVIVSFGSGTKNIYGSVDGGIILLIQNLFSEIAALGSGSQATALTNLGLSTVALLKANNLSDVASTSTALTNLGAASATHVHNGNANALSGQSGGSAGQVVRLTGTANTWTAAAQGDTAEQLAVLGFIDPAGNYRPPGSLISGLSGLDVTQWYYLSTTAGQMTPFATGTAPTADSTHRRVFLGRALSTTTFLFTPYAPVTG